MKPILLCFSVLLLFCLFGCTQQPKTPDCNADVTKEIVLKKAIYYGEIKKAAEAGHKPSKEVIQATMDNDAKLQSWKYSNGKLEIHAGNGTIAMVSSLKDVRTINFNKDIGKYECSADWVVKSPDKKEEDMRVDEGLSYTTELADGKPYITMTMGNIRY